MLATLRPDRLAGIAWWRLLGKRLRAQYRLRDAIATLPFAYERRIEAEGRADLKLLCSGTPASFAIHIHRADASRAAKNALESCLRQSVTAKRVLITGQGEVAAHGREARVHILAASCGDRMAGLRLALQEAQRQDIDYLVPLRPEVTLPRDALAGYAAASARVDRSNSGPLPILYADQDEAGRSGRGRNAWLKPAWDARMILSQDYVTTACALPVAETLRVLDDIAAPPRNLYALLLRLALADDPVPVQHVPRIAARTPPGDWAAHGEALAEALLAERAPGDMLKPGPFGTACLQRPLPMPLPRISVVVATRDKVELLRTCIDGLLHETDYPALEIIIADNDSREPGTLQYMDEASTDPRVKVVRWPHPFNYSAINNFAAGHASGEYLCLLNNDIEILHADWLQAMLREAVQPGVGAVGARLLYPDRSIQHAGVVIGMGNAAGHAHRALPEGEAGYFAQALVARGASAVTAACLLLRKSHFDAVGGLDEDHLAVAYNDVDLCLKLRALGLANIYTPAATLVHHESKSRGQDFSPEHLQRYLRELAVFQRRWGTDTAVDPWHHPQLDRSSEVYAAQNLA